jgi:long-chain acyl-CoA synthetase
VRGYDDTSLIWWPDLIDRGRAHRREHSEALRRSMDAVTEDDVATVIYTSGTTGPPKGAMLTVRNVNFAIAAMVDGGGFFPDVGQDDVILSYISLAHVADRIGTEWVNARAGSTVHFAESIDTVQQDLREVQPSVFFAVPRIWKKIHGSVQVGIASASRLKRLNYEFWMRRAQEIGRDRARNGGAHTTITRLRYALGYPFLYRSLRKAIGMQRCRHAASGGAPIAPEILEWFLGVGVVIHEIYGMAENSDVATANRPGRTILGTVGEPLPGIELRIDEATGVILIKHPGVFGGYWGNPGKTAEALGGDGWLNSGDAGEWVEGTHVRIVGRIEDAFVLSDGRKISPSEIEEALKASPFIRDAVVTGSGRPFLAALVGIEFDTVGNWARRRRIPYTTYRDLSDRPEILRMIQAVIRETNQRLSNAEAIRKFRTIPKELDHRDGELTATQTVKRAAITRTFGHLVEDMYAGRIDHAGGDLDEVHSSKQREAPGGRAASWTSS